jgi:hypothetical protein
MFKCCQLTIAGKTEQRFLLRRRRVAGYIFDYLGIECEVAPIYPANFIGRLFPKFPYQIVVAISSTLSGPAVGRPQPLQLCRR